MPKVKTTYEKAHQFLMAAQMWLSKDKSRANTKFGWALQRVLPRVQKVLGQYNDRLEELRIDLCSADDAGNVLKDAHKELVFTKENLKKFNAERQKLYESFEVEIEAYHATKLPPLTLSEHMAFEGFVIAEGQEPEEPEEPQAKPEQKTDAAGA